MIRPAHRLASTLRARSGLALLLAAAAVLVTVGAASLLPERHTATAQVLLGGQGGARPEPGASGASLATQADIVTSGRVALKVVDALRLAGDPAVLERWKRTADGQGSLRHFAADRALERVRAQPGPDSGLLVIAFSGDDPASAARGANAFARAYVETLAEIRDESARRFAGSAPRRADGPTGSLERLEAVVLDGAREPIRPDGPGLASIAAFGLAAGALLALAGVAFAEWRRPGVRTVGDVARVLQGGAAVPVEVMRSGLPGAASSGAAGAGSVDAGPGTPGRAGTPGSDGVETRTFAPHDARRGEPGDAPDTVVRPVDLDPPTIAAPPRSPAPDWGGRAGLAAAAADTGGSGRAEGAGRADGSGAARDAPAGAATAAVVPARGPAREPIGAMLVREGLIHPPEVERTLAWARQEGLRFGEAAVARRLLTPRQLERALASQFDFPLLDAERSGVSQEVVAAFDARNPLMADLRRIRARLEAALPAGPAGRCVAVVAPGPRAGRSFLAANLAVCLAQAGRRTLLVDADLRAGRQHALFGLVNRTGLSSMLNRRIDPGALQRVPGLRDLTVVPCGPQAPNPAELLSRDTFGHLLASFRLAYDAVILDTSGVEDEPDAALVAGQAGAVLLVARRDADPLDALRATVRSLRDDRVAIATAVFNRA